jgi:hypothetical protein
LGEIPVIGEGHAGGLDGKFGERSNLLIGIGLSTFDDEAGMGIIGRRRQRPDPGAGGEGIQKVPDFDPGAEIGLIAVEEEGFPGAKMDGAGGPIDSRRNRECDEGAGNGALETEIEVAGLGQPSIERERVFVVYPIGHLLQISGQEEGIDIALGGGIGLQAGDQGKPDHPIGEVEGGILSFPDQILIGPPRPGDFLGDTPSESPYPGVVPDAVGMPKDFSSRLFERDLELGFTAEGCLIPNEEGIPTGLIDGKLATGPAFGVLGGEGEGCLTAKE